MSAEHENEHTQIDESTRTKDVDAKVVHECDKSSGPASLDASVAHPAQHQPSSIFCPEVYSDVVLSYATVVSRRDPVSVEWFGSPVATTFGIVRPRLTSHIGGAVYIPMLQLHGTIDAFDENEQLFSITLKLEDDHFTHAITFPAVQISTPEHI